MQRKFPYIKINRPKELAKRLGIPLDVLRRVSENLDMHYHSWTSEKTGKPRDFYCAAHDLEAIHDKLNREIFDRFDFPTEFQGAIQGRSLRSNALLHSKKKNVSHFDIKRFFPSVSPKRVYDTFVRLGCQPDVARLITRLVTAKGHLPQGFKTSPKVAALTLIPVKERLAGLTSGLKVSSSFWVDDLTLSGAYPLRKLRPSVRKIFRSAGFTVHKDQEPPTYGHQRQMVTGVVVNDKPSVKSEVRQEIEKVVFLSEKNGLRWYRRNHARHFGLVKLGRKIGGKIANMMAIDADKYAPLQERWKKVLESGYVTK